jgi:hypothetical protein
MLSTNQYLLTLWIRFFPFINFIAIIKLVTLLWIIVLAICSHVLHLLFDVFISCTLFWIHILCFIKKTFLFLIPFFSTKWLALLFYYIIYCIYDLRLSNNLYKMNFISGIWAKRYNCSILFYFFLALITIPNYYFHTRFHSVTIPNQERTQLNYWLNFLSNCNFHTFTYIQLWVYLHFYPL